VRTLDYPKLYLQLELRDAETAMRENIQLAAQSRDYVRIERAIIFFEENYLDQPDLEDIAAAAGLSTTHFQSMLKRWAGI
jgi:AraC-like DNA-binding protein